MRRSLLFKQVVPPHQLWKTGNIHNVYVSEKFFPIASLLCSNLVLSGQTKSPNSEVSLKFRKNFLTPWPLLGLEPTSPQEMRNKWSQGNLSTQSSHFLLLDHTLGILCPNGPKLISKTCIRPFPDLFFEGQIALSISVPLAQRSGQGTTVCRGIDRRGLNMYTRTTMHDEARIGKRWGTALSLRHHVLSEL